MAYSINLTDGTLFATVADGTINTSSSMTLVGKNYAGYGAFLDENFIHLLENGSNTTAPGSPLTGQLWFDKSSGINLLKVYNGTTWKTIGAATSSATAPTSNTTGDLWFDTNNGQLNVYDGSGFILVGPASSSSQGTSGAIVATITDNVGGNHVVIELYTNDTLVAMVSKDTAFTPGTSIPGWGTQLVQPGITLSENVTGALFQGTAYDSDRLGGVAAANYLRSDTADTTTGSLTIQNNDGLTVGSNLEGKFVVSSGDVIIRNVSQDANLRMTINDGGTTKTVMQAFGGNAAVVFPNVAVSVTGLTNYNSNGVGNLGSSSSYFNTVFATATTALYADVAERFASDAEYPAGTVVEIGGNAEITISSQELSENVFGVISTNAAYLMNAGAGDDKTHPPIALSGRVPVRVTGTIRKGDRLVSAGNGLARSAQSNEATAFNVIGRALQDHDSDIEGTIEAVVIIK